MTFAVLYSLSSCTEGKKVLTLDDGGSDKALEDPLKNKGLGPIKNVEIGALSHSIADKGKVIFEAKCAACHKFKERVVGPPLLGVTKRRTPEWIMNLILNTNEMVEKDPIVKSMLAEYMTKMTFQDISRKEARALLEYFRKKDSK